FEPRSLRPQRRILTTKLQPLRWPLFSNGLYVLVFGLPFPENTCVTIQCRTKLCITCCSRDGL
ncbi:hypothetical protein LINGRAHAP2_LOCUS37313, partial [Linum grandiflorum]